MRDRVLNNESYDTVRVRERHPKADWTAVILHVERVTREPERFGEMVHDVGVVIERVREFFWIRPVAVSKARIVRRDQMKAIGKTSEKRLKHPR